MSAPNKGGKKKLAWLLPSVEEEEGFSNAEKTKRVEESCHSLHLKLDLHASHHLLITGKKTWWISIVNFKLSWLCLFCKPITISNCILSLDGVCIKKSRNVGSFQISVTFLLVFWKSDWWSNDGVRIDAALCFNSRKSSDIRQNFSIFILFCKLCSKLVKRPSSHLSSLRARRDEENAWNFNFSI